MYASRSSNQNSIPSVEVVDSSAARRRSSALPYDDGRRARSDEQDFDDGGKGEKVGGYAMEGMYGPPSPGLNGGGREFMARGVDSSRRSKWDKLIPENREPQTWVRTFPLMTSQALSWRRTEAHDRAPLRVFRLCRDRQQEV